MREDQLDKVFTLQNCPAARDANFLAVRAAGKELAKVIFENCPPCADRTAALRKVREVVMTANASIALNGEV